MFNRVFSRYETILSLLQGHRGKLLASLLFAVTSGFVSLIPFLIVYRMAGHIESGTIGKEIFFQLALFTLIAVVARYGLFYISTMLAHLAAFTLNCELKSDIVTHMGELNLGYFDKKTSGAIKKSLGEDIDNLELFIAHHLPDTMVAVSISAIVFITLLIVDIRLAIAAFLSLPFSIYMQSLAKREYMDNAGDYHDNQEKMNSIIVEYIKGMPIIKTFNLNVRSFHRFIEAVETHIRLAAEIVKKVTPFQAFFRTGIDSGLLFIVAAGSWLFLIDEISFPTLVLFILIGNSFAGPFHEISMTTALLENITEGARRISHHLETPGLKESTQPRIPGSADIEFKKVSFSFGDNRVLRNISFSVKEGDLCALVGPSGAGKTTATLLASRFWDVEQGEITIGGVDIRDIPQQKLMEMVSFVFQDVFLINGTILENICMGNTEISEDDAILAAKQAMADDFISRLEHGYHTTIGEKGTFLSGGEKQRIAIARAIAKNSPIVILDEATAFTDPENEIKIQEALNRLLVGRTVIVIAHKLHTIMEADKILVFEKGAITGQGSHACLLEENSLYGRMWQEHTKANSWLLAGRRGNHV